MFRHSLTRRKAMSLESGKFADGFGLWLTKRHKNAGRWFLWFTINGALPEMGLDPWPNVTIAEARERAYEARRAVRDGSQFWRGFCSQKFTPFYKYPNKSPIQYSRRPLKILEIRSSL